MFGIRVQDQFARGLPLRARVLDIGCSNFERFHRYVGKSRPDLDVLGVEKFVDRSIYGELFHPVPSGRNAPAYSRIACDIEHNPLPLSTGSVDGVYFSHVIEHLNKKQEVIAEVDRVLRPGGLLYIETPGPASGHFKRPIGLPETFGGTIHYNDDPTHLGHPLSVEDLLGMLATTSLTITASGAVRELGIAGAPLYALMSIAGRIPVLPYDIRSALYGAGERNRIGFGIYAIAVKRERKPAEGRDIH